jgi:hypothetical protein
MKDMVRPATIALLLAISGAISGLAAIRALVAKALLARGCTEDMGYRLDVDGTTMTSAGCVLDRAGRVVVVPGLPFWPVAVALMAALTCVMIAGVTILGSHTKLRRRATASAVAATGTTFGLGLVSLSWWRSHNDQAAACRDSLGGTTAAWAYCRVGEHGAVPMQPTWPSIAVFASAVLVVVATGILTLWSVRYPR